MQEMQELQDKFKNLIDFRSRTIDDKFGKNASSAFNFSENRFWYADFIYPIDQEIIKVANEILKDLDKYTLPLHNIADVFNNELLKNIYNSKDVVKETER